MAAIDDLKKAVARLAASTAAELQAVAAALTGIGSSDPAVEQAATDLNAIADKLDAETATLTGTKPSSLPVISAISPTSGSAGQSIGMTVAGSNFAAGDQVLTDNTQITVSGVTTDSPTQISATFSLGTVSPGAVQVVVRNAAGASNVAQFDVV